MQDRLSALMPPPSQRIMHRGKPAHPFLPVPLHPGQKAYTDP
jgi:hypothetical protein